MARINRSVLDDQSARPPPASRSRSSSLIRQRAASGGLPSKASNSSTSDGGHDHDGHEGKRTPPVPPLPQIPLHFLENNRPATVSLPPAASNAKLPRPPSLHVQRPSSSFNDRSPHDEQHGGVGQDASEIQPSLDKKLRRLSLPTLKAREAARLALEGGTSTDTMEQRRSRDRNESLFLQSARDNEQQSAYGDEDRESSLRERVRSRAEKRRSLPVGLARPPPENRPRTAGGDGNNRTPESSFASQLRDHVNRYGNSRLTATPSVASFNTAEEGMSMSGRRSSRLQRHFPGAERSPMSPSQLGERVTSPEVSERARRRRSLGLMSVHSPSGLTSQALKADEHSESAAESSELKQSNLDSDSANSQGPAETVWDELDDLKSRIKKLELTGKIPATSGAAVSGGSSIERPRTATTAPTTIDSSPKHEKNPVSSQKASGSEIGSVAPSSLHPLLHAALAKAKPLLNPALWRTLEATAADALQLAIMTGGGSGPQGTMYSAASVVGASMGSDRQVKRRADAMCRNLTDLCLALCEGKLDAPTYTASPVAVDHPTRNTPPARRDRTSLLGPPPASNRPVSRLDARRSSFGLQPLLGAKSQAGMEDVSASEQQTSRRLSRTSNSRLSHSRQGQYDGVSGEDEPAARPLSRAGTDGGSVRKAMSTAPYDSIEHDPYSSTRRRTAIHTYDGHRQVTRVASMSSELSRRRFLERSTPPVVEEGGSEADYQQQVTQSRRRFAPLGHHSARRTGDFPQRAMSLQQQRRDVLVE